MRWVLTLTVLAGVAGAQPLRPENVVARVDRYLAEYGTQLENVVVDEVYHQQALGGGGLDLVRTLRSDYALTFLTGRQEWLGYRDTFEVDGQEVRGRDDRLRRLLGSGATDQAAQITAQNARYNLASERFARTVNTPTLAFELLQPRYRDRFQARRIGAASLGDRVGWVLAFTERRRPTIIRTPQGRNRASRIELLVDPLTGAVHRSTLSWDGVSGTVVVEFGRVADMPVLVPLKMAERFMIGPGDRIEDDATYANYRSFQTSGRLITP